MTKERQRGIGSGFTVHTTADEVLAGIDLTGRLAIVTGGYSGIGLATTRALARAGAHVVVPARRPEQAGQAVGAEVDQLDLSDLASVRAFAERFLASGRQIDIMINSADVVALPETPVGPGWEGHFATNHLGHFALVNRLRPAFTKETRVVSVSSAGHHESDIRWDDLHFTREPYDRWQAYGQSKTANVLFAVHLDNLGVRSYAPHPGRVDVRSPEQGAATQVWAATSPQLADLGGLYLEDCEVAELTDDSAAPGVRDYAVDPEAAAWLWRLSAQMTGVAA